MNIVIKFSGDIDMFGILFSNQTSYLYFTFLKFSMNRTNQHVITCERKQAVVASFQKTLI